MRPTAAEIEAIKMVCRRGTAKEAAAALGIGHQAVKNRLMIAYARLGVEFFPEAVYELWLKDLWGEQ